MLLDGSHYLLDFLLESQIEHAISFVEHCVSEARKVEILSLHVVLDASSGTNENIDASPELVGLVVDRNATVNGEHVKFSFRVFECIQLFGNLHGKLARWRKNHGKGFTLTECPILP